MYLKPVFLAVLVALTVAPIVHAEDITPPTNAPAKAQWDADSGRLTLEYHGEIILSTTVQAKNADGKNVAVKFEPNENTTEEKVEQRLRFTPAIPVQRVCR